MLAKMAEGNTPLSDIPELKSPLLDGCKKSIQQKYLSDHGETTMTKKTPIIEVTNLDKFYGTFHALKNINLTIHQGDKMVICGPSGSGKSTLLRCFNGLEFHNSGKLVIDKIEVH
jgi:ABC-type bacteriocin/lantibiotic exporter with double-glycine peptidase domain